MGQRLIHHVYTVPVVVCQKAPVRLKQHLTVKNIKPIVLVVVKLHLSEGAVIQSVTQSVNRSVEYFIKHKALKIL